MGLNNIKPKDTGNKEAFIQGANTHTIKLNPNEKPTRSFTIPVNDFDLDLLKRVADKNNRSMRKEARKLLIEALLKE